MKSLTHDFDLKFPFSNVYFKLRDVLKLRNKKIYVLKTLILFYCKIFP